MSSIARYAIVLAISLSCAVCSSVANSQTKTPKKTPPNSVSGRVTVHGKPAAGIVVAIRRSDFSPEGPPSLKGITDQDGNYQIINIPSGSFQVSPIAPAYSNPDLTLSWARGKMLLLGEGEDVQDIDFSMVRGAVITGKVSDANGRPVIEETLMIVREDEAAQGGRGLQGVVGRFRTDDRGIYRIYGLPAGRYKISVGVSQEDFYSFVRLGRVAYNRTFHPAATDPNEADVVEVKEGSEATDIDITVGGNLPRFVISGAVLDGETGKPFPGVRFALRRMVKDRAGSTVQGMFATSNSRGEFRLDNVTPGKYVVVVIAQAGSEVRAEPVPLEVIDQNVTGLMIRTVKGLTLTGNVVLEGTNDKSVFAKLAQLRLRANVHSEIVESDSGHDSPINLDGSFRIGGLAPGTVHLYLTTPERHTPSTFAILRVERAGVVQQRGVDMKAGENVSGVQLIVGYGSGSVRGEVKLENGPLPEGGRLSVWLKKTDGGNSKTGSHNLDARGHFLIQGVAAGDYELNVNANIPGRRTAATKQSITVAEGVVSNVVVILDLNANPGPNP